jgi:beta-glucosidase
MEEKPMQFPEGFVWGAAAASYQIEGAAEQDGKGLSVWDRFSRQAGKIWSGNTGDVACDHYHRYKEDVALMADIGLQAYRLSISWPRVMPEGIGKVNEKGLAFYDALVDELLSKGIEPWVTLFHWDYPYELYQRGGWQKRESADWFAEYTQAIVDRLSDRVSHWITQNEPQCFVGLGHQLGHHAPGDQLEFGDVLRVAHHSLLAHGKAVQVIRASARKTPRIGAAPVGVIDVPLTDLAADVEAARKSTFSITKRDCWNNTWFADPMVLGHYPEDGLALFGADVPDIAAGDMETICQPLDFYGANIYFAMQTVKDDGSGGIESCPSPDGPPLTSFGWEINEKCLYWGPRFLYERYKLPIVVTENGMANCDWVHLDGKVHDPQRIDYVTRHLQEYRRAIGDGVKAEGYFLWSILDNFEWADGYKQRFGIIHVDYATGTRTPKDSAHWYRQVINTQGARLRNDDA